MLVLYFNNIVAVVLEHYKKKERNNQTDKQCKETLGTKFKCGERYCIFPKMYCCGRAWSVKSKLRMIFFYIILHPAVLIYDFHIFITSSSSFHGFITNQFNDLLWVGLLAQLSKVRILYKPEFFQAFFSQLQKLRNYNCDDLLSCKNYFCGVSLKHLLVCFVRKDHPVFINF